MIAVAEKVTGHAVHAIKSDRRPGDPAILITSSEEARKELAWQPKYESLEAMIEDAWNAMP